MEVHWQDNDRYRLDHPRSAQVSAIVDGTFLGRYLHPKEMRRVRDQVTYGYYGWFQARPEIYRDAPWVDGRYGQDEE